MNRPARSPKFSDLRTTRVSTLRTLALTVLAALVLPIAAQAQGFGLRIMAANITSGRDQAYETPGKRILKGLEPDVVLIQEFNHAEEYTLGQEAIRLFIDETFGPDFHYHREEGEGIPNGIISRWPILEAGEWADETMGNRDFAWARIDIPGNKDLWAVSLHLKASKRAENRAQRVAQAKEVVRQVKLKVPKADYLVIGGDFNAQNFQEPFFKYLGEVVRIGPPYAADAQGKTGTNSSRKKPYDWVLVDADLEVFSMPVEIGDQVFPHGLVFDSRVFRPLATVFPVQAGDSGVANMQHMAVVKDFLVPLHEAHE